MPDLAPDAYTVRAGETRTAPTGLRGRLRYLGPSIIVSGSVVGSGEIIPWGLRSEKGVRAALWATLLFQTLMAALVVRYVVFG